MKQLFLGLSIFLVCINCKRNEEHPKIPRADVEITQKINTLYKTYGKSSDAIYNQSIPKFLFSHELEETFQEAIDSSKADIEKVKNSDHPTDKPLLMEGSVFTSLYEGYTSYTIKSIDVKESTQPLGAAADVIIDFENSQVSPKITWTDKIHLVNPYHAGWRIDNITFSENLTGENNLKSSLQNFISGAK
ncbi:hypothetical protein [Chryseobacterium sp. ERMR1:04]|uniref:hypothetical protein n=1 Tax=Chryseobacterium sp. ERMR1:04 TaxID=1705393 RepID=UPI0006C84EEA|nr:hypothetical protein [Chryseobacterium sp. ERMR1:04]KPH14460.1 hypothetical protein AMQ68_02975 [Chryseobacterium sp. ERMR1:04]